jgi:hypothetical protein
VRQFGQEQTTVMNVVQNILTPKKMALQYLNKVATPDMIDVTVKKCFKPEMDNYGSNKMNCIVKWRETEYYLSVKEKDFGRAKEGNALTLFRKIYKKDGKDYPYFELYVDEAGQAIEQIPSPSEQAFHEVFTPQAPKRDFEAEKNDRILRSQCLNLSAQMGNKEDALLPLAKLIYEDVKNWVNNI